MNWSELEWTKVCQSGTPMYKSEKWSGASSGGCQNIGDCTSIPKSVLKHTIVCKSAPKYPKLYPGYGLWVHFWVAKRTPKWTRVHTRADLLAAATPPAGWCSSASRPAYLWPPIHPIYIIGAATEYIYFWQESQLKQEIHQRNTKKILSVCQILGNFWFCSFLLALFGAFRSGFVLWYFIVFRLA